MPSRITNSRRASISCSWAPMGIRASAACSLAARPRSSSSVASSPLSYFGKKHHASGRTHVVAWVKVKSLPVWQVQQNPSNAAHPANTAHPVTDAPPQPWNCWHLHFLKTSIFVTSWAQTPVHFCPICMHSTETLSFPPASFAAPINSRQMVLGELPLSSIPVMSCS